MKPIIKRFVRLFIGLCIMSFGSAMALVADLGMEPWDVLNDGMAKFLHRDGRLYQRLLLRSGGHARRSRSGRFGSGRTRHAAVGRRIGIGDGHFGHIRPFRLRAGGSGTGGVTLTRLYDGHRRIERRVRDPVMRFVVLAHDRLPSSKNPQEKPVTPTSSRQYCTMIRLWPDPHISNDFQRTRSYSTVFRRRQPRRRRASAMRLLAAG